MMPSEQPVEKQEESNREMKNASRAAVLEKLLEGCSKAIQETKNEDAKAKLIKEEATNLINAFTALLNSGWQEDFFGIIDHIIDIFMTVNDARKDVQQYLILSLTEKCMGIFVSPLVKFIHKIEILKSFNTVLEKCSNSTKKQLLAEDCIMEKIVLLCKVIYEAGELSSIKTSHENHMKNNDYELQVCTIEFLFRLVPRSLRQDYLRSFTEDNSLFAQFLNIQDNKFETDCRNFLNILNMQKTYGSNRIYSFPADLVKLDGEKLHKPADEGYDKFWIDFNSGSQRLEIFCEPNSLSSQQSQSQEQLWETICIWIHDVKKYTCAVQGKIWKAAIELKPGAQMLSNKEDDGQIHLITIDVPKEYDLEKAIGDTFKKYVKASSADNPVAIVQKNCCPERVIGPTALKCTSQQSRDSPIHSLTKSKVSVPFEPMTTPASSVITSLSEQTITLQMPQSKQKKQGAASPILVGSEPQGKIQPCKEKKIIPNKVRTKSEQKNIKDAANHPREAVLNYDKGNATPSDCMARRSAADNTVSIVQKNGCPQRLISPTSQQSKDNPIHSVTKSKVSVPLEPMTTPASSVITSLPEQTIALQMLQNKQKKQEVASPILVGSEPQGKIQPCKEKTVIQNKVGTKSKKSIKDAANHSREAVLEYDNNNAITIDDKVRRSTEFLGIGDLTNKESGDCLEVCRKNAKTVAKNSDANKIKQHKLQRQVQTSETHTGIRKHKSIMRGNTTFEEAIGIDSPVTAGGDNNCGLRRSRRGCRNISHVSESNNQRARNTKPGREKEENTVNEGIQSKKMETGQGGKRTTPGPCSAEEKGNEPPKTPSSHKRSLRKLKTPVVSVQIPEKKDENRPHPEVLRGSIPHVQLAVQKEPEERGPAEETKVLPGRNDDDINELLVQEPTVSSFYEEQQTEKKKKNGHRQTIVKDRNSADDQHNGSKTLNPPVKYISPGNVSLDEFKPSKNFKSLGNSRKCKQVRKKQTEKYGVNDNQMAQFDKTTTQYASMNIGDEEECKRKTLKDFLKPLQVKEEFHGMNISKDTKELTVNTKTQLKTQLTYGADPQHHSAVSAEACCGPSEINAVDPSEKPVGADASVCQPDVSSSGSGELYIEIDRAEPAERGCDVVAETQLENSSPVSCQVEQMSTEEHQSEVPSSQIIEDHKKQNDKGLGTTGGLKSSNKGVERPSGTESSYVFQKYIVSKEQQATHNQRMAVNSKAVNRDDKKCHLKQIDAEKPGEKNKRYGNDMDEDKNSSWDTSAESVHPESGIKSHESVSKFHPVSSPYISSSNNHLNEELEHEISMKATSKVSLPGNICKSGHNLRARNKAISYKECDADDISLLAEKGEQKQSGGAKVSPTKLPEFSPAKILVSDNDHMVTHESYYVSATPSEDRLIKTQENRKSMSKLGSFAPKKLLKRQGLKQHGICSNHQVKRTFTTTSYSEYTHHHFSSDPYDFEAASRESCLCSPVLPLSSFRDLNIPEKSTLDIGGSTKSKMNLPKSVKPGRQNKTCSYAKNLRSQSVVEKKLNKHSHWTKERSSDKGFKLPTKQSMASLSKDSKIEDLSNLDKCGNNKEEGSSEIGLFLSEMNMQNPGSSRVFSSLDHSIPYTSYSNIDSEITRENIEKKSAASDFSWIVKESAPAAKREKMRGKTYLKNKHDIINVVSASEEEDREFGPLYSDLHAKITSKNLITVPKAKKRKRVYRDRGVLSSLDIINVSRHSYAPAISESVDRYESGSKCSEDCDISDVIEEFSENGQHSPNIQSGPSSLKRPTKSELKRMYPGISSDTSGESHESVADDEVHDEPSQSKSGCARRKLFETDIFLEKRCDVPAQSKAIPRKSICSSLAMGNKQLLLTSTITTPFKKGGQNCRTPVVSAEKSVTSTEGKRKSQGELDFSPLQKSKREVVLPRWKSLFASGYISEDHATPEKGRSDSMKSAPSAKVCRHSLDMSPIGPLIMSPSTSPIMEPSSNPLSELDLSQPELPAMKALLNTVRQELLKTNLSQVSEGSSGVSASQSDERTVAVTEQTSTTLESQGEQLVHKKGKFKSLVNNDDIQGAMQSTSKFINSTWATEKTDRICALAKFQDVIQKVFTRMRKDHKEMAEIEMQTTMLWSQQIEKLRNYRISQGKIVKRLKQAHNELANQLRGVQKDQETKQKTLKTKLKQDVDALKKKLLARYNERSLETMKKCLQASIMFS